MRRAAAIIMAASVCLLVLTGCSSVPDGVLPPGKMASLLADMEIGESVVESDPSSWRSDSLKMVLRQSIYERHGVTSEEVDSSLAWYGAHVEKMPEVYDRVIEILDKRVREAREAGVGKIDIASASPVTQDGDSVDIWPLDRTWMFSPRRRAADIITFAIERDRNFETGDSYVLRYRLSGGDASTRATLAAQYSSGISDYVVSSSSAARGWQNLTLSVDSATTTSSVFGAIAVTPSGRGAVIVDSVSLVRLHQRQGRKVVSSRRFRSRR